MADTETRIREAGAKWREAQQLADDRREELIAACQVGLAEGVSQSRLAILAEVQRQTIRAWLKL